MKISIIIPVYNTEKYLSECLDSLVYQSFDDFEIICIDDASTDTSVSILESYSQKFDMIKTICLKTNRGQANARNVGLENAKGKYIYFLDSDDKLIDNNSLRIMYEYAEKKNVDCITFDSEIIYENEELKLKNRNVKVLTYEMPEGIYDGKDFFEGMVNSRCFSVAVWKQFWKKDYFLNKKILFEENTSPIEDLLFTFEAICSAEKIYYLKNLLHLYRIRENSSMTMKFNKKRYLAYCNCYLKAMRFVDEMDFSSDKLSMLKKYFSCINDYISNYFIDMISAGEDLFDVKREGKEELYLHQLLLAKYPLVSRFFSKKEYDQIMKANKIVVYGAGKMGKTVAKMLFDIGIYDFEIAVSEQSENMNFGNRRINLITDYSFNGEEILVIVAVTSVWKDELCNKLKQNGCDNYIVMCE